MAEQKMEDEAIIAYRRVAQEIFQVGITNSLTKQITRLVKGDIEHISENEVLMDLIDVSLHVLFHWAREWESPKGAGSGPEVTVGTFLQMIQDMTVHICPALNGTLGAESDL